MKNLIYQQTRLYIAKQAFVEIITQKGNCPRQSDFESNRWDGSQIAGS
jgi:hypothetical protein